MRSGLDVQGADQDQRCLALRLYDISVPSDGLPQHVVEQNLDSAFHWRLIAAVCMCLEMATSALLADGDRCSQCSERVQVGPQRLPAGRCT